VRKGGFRALSIEFDEPPDNSIILPVPSTNSSQLNTVELAAVAAAAAAAAVQQTQASSTPPRVKRAGVTASSTPPLNANYLDQPPARRKNTDTSSMTAAHQAALQETYLTGQAKRALDDNSNPLYLTSRGGGGGRPDPGSVKG